jgi:hypothetical protein
MRPWRPVWVISGSAGHLDILPRTLPVYLGKRTRIAHVQSEPTVATFRPGCGTAKLRLTCWPAHAAAIVWPTRRVTIAPIGWQRRGASVSGGVKRPVGLCGAPSSQAR